MIAEQKGKTERGNFFSIIQDTPTLFHISVSMGQFTYHDFIESPTGMDVLYTKVKEVEDELMERFISGSSVPHEPALN